MRRLPLPLCHRKTDRQTGIHTGRQTDRHTGRQTETEKRDWPEFRMLNGATTIPSYLHWSK